MARVVVEQRESANPHGRGGIHGVFDRTVAPAGMGFVLAVKVLGIMEEKVDTLHEAVARIQEMLRSDEPRVSLSINAGKIVAMRKDASLAQAIAGADLVANLKRKYGSHLAARFVVNKELLGGMRIRVGSDVWDSSVRNRLHRLQQQL